MPFRCEPPLRHTVTAFFFFLFFSIRFWTRIWIGLIYKMKAKLLTRGDDFGSFKTANLAIKDCVDQGILKNVSIMMITDYWEDAVEMFKGRNDVCLGVHLSINCEWDNINWKPVLPAEKIPSLLAEDGSFRQNIQDQQHAALDEIMAECKAQVDLARSKGLNIEYIDEHCCFGWFQEDKLSKLIADFANQEGLVYLTYENFIHIPEFEKGNIDSYVDSLKNLEPENNYIMVGHPCYPVDEIAKVVHPGMKIGDVPIQRDFQRQMFMHPDVIKTVESTDIELIKYTDL